MMQKPPLNLYRFLVLCLTGTFFIFGCSDEPRYDLVIEEVGFFDGAKDHGRVSLGLRSDFLAVVSREKLHGDSVISGQGKYVIPGLVNSHTHIWTTEQLREGYAHGILANIGLHASNLERDRNIKDTSHLPGYPHYYTSGFAATVPQGHPTQVSSFPIETINDSVSTRDFVRNRIREGADLIKIIHEDNEFFGMPPLPTLPYDSVAALIRHANENGLKAVVHIGRLEELLRIAEDKPSGFVHLWNYKMDSGLTEDRLKKIAGSGAFIVPTALLQERGEELLEQEGGFRLQWMRENFLDIGSTKEAIRKLHESGVVIVAGTDNGNLNLNWGDDLLEELRIYREAGLSNLEVLKTATGNAADAWEIPVGRMKEGDKLNMVLLEGNPLEDLQALRNVIRIWKSETGDGL